ncbi:hypothetical protein [Fibrivirga algicola]|uniref:Uncharacterized protein n=1 Tax=Fibrivirga algicola TaxID=2950420 RepID=A0ABX0QAD7_9BACT|nr:hypothetical protein [Fibrivirga algicola]NID09204.1 hypothetical protein [Fibrivirga algicola]
MKYVLFFVLIISLLPTTNTTCVGQTATSQVKKAISAGDIIRTAYSDTANINLYQGNGRFGSSYGSLGLHNNPHNQTTTNRYGKTQYMHIDHWVRGKFNADYLVPLLKIYWQDEPKAIRNYVQHQVFYQGTVETRFETSLGKLSVETWFDAVDRDLSGIAIDLTGQTSAVVIEPLELLTVHYSQQIAQKVALVQHQNSIEIQLDCLGKKSSVFLSTTCQVRIKDNQLVLTLRSGKNAIQLSYNKPVDVSPETSKNRSAQWWQRTWTNSSNLMLPDKQAQRLWVSSMALILSTYNEDKKGFSPPMGFTGNGWPFAFPQDLSFIHSVLLKSGNLPIAKSWIEHFAANIEGMKSYTRRFYGVDGICAPWTFPYGSFAGYHDPATPNKFYFEIHNSGYLCRMACETDTYVNDSNWTRKNVVELIRQTALFYRSISKKGPDGFWHLFVNPSMGQDEKGGFNQTDYLDALYSAKYCFQKAVEYKLDSDNAYKSILADGLAFPTLLSGDGFYQANKGLINEPTGGQKHPVQLNALAFLPVNERVTRPDSMAYQKRYSITLDANKPYFFGWTLGEFLLAGSRMGDVSGWQTDWANLTKSDYVDAEWIQLYETSRAHTESFYSITNGLVVQSLLANLVDDWFTKLEIAKCNPWKGPVSFTNIHSVLGVRVNGTINGKTANLLIMAWKDCQFTLGEKRIQLKKGEGVTAKIDQGKLQ